MDTHEALITSSNSNQQWTACLWNYTTRNALHYFKGGGALAPKTLNLLSKDYMIAADIEKPLVHLWPLNSQEPIKKLQTVLPDKLSVLTVCPRNTYLAGAIHQNLSVWHISSGKLLTVQNTNFQDIVCIKFSNDGNYLALGSLDAILVVYRFDSLISMHSTYRSESEAGQVEPLYTRSDHSSAIIDIHVGVFGSKSRLATASKDRSCRIYALSTGDLLVNFIFKEPLTAVIFDGPCWNLYVGDKSGRIWHHPLKDLKQGEDIHVDDKTCCFQDSHEKAVSCLDLNVAGTLLASGSEDGQVWIWEVRTRNTKNRLGHGGGITNVKFVLNYQNFYVQSLRPTLVVKTLEREQMRNFDDFVVSKIQDFDIELSDDENVTCEESNPRIEELEAENMRLRIINSQLFEAALEVSKKYNKS